MSDYPEVWDFEKEGNAILTGKLVGVNAVTAKKYGTDDMVQKFVANIETADGTTYAIWLDSAVLNRAFSDEARNRKAQGKSGFETDEEITIEYLGKRQGATYKYKDFRVDFQFAAPSVGGFDALAGVPDHGETVTPEAPVELQNPLKPNEGQPGSRDDDATAEAVEESGMLGADEEIPF